MTFKHLNLIKPWPSGMSFDVIFCRNVAIFFDAKTKASLVNRFTRSSKMAVGSMSNSNRFTTIRNNSS